MLEPRRWTSPRITTVPGKIAYVAAWWLGGAGGFRLLLLLGAPDATSAMFGASWDITFLIAGAQIFRARGEVVEPVRPWWQATGRVKASRVLGVLIGFVALVGAVQIVMAMIGIGGEPIYGMWSLAVTTIEWALASAFYFNSAARLKRRGAGAPPLEKFRRPRAGHFANS